MPKILHTSDFHLDAPFSSQRDKAHIRRKELRESFKKVCALIESENVDIALFCGDVFDGECVYEDTVELMVSEFSKVKGARIFIAPGNHDYYSSKLPYSRDIWPENVHIFKSREIERVFIPELETAVYGAAFTSLCEDKSLLSGFSAEDKNEVSVMALHADISPQSPYNPITEDEIKESGLDCLALGHIHQSAGLKKAGKTFYSYCGCPEGRGFDECGVKGVNLLDVQKGLVKCDFIPLGGRVYNIVSVDITNTESQSDIKRAVLDAGAILGKENCIRFVLTGQSDTIPDITGLEAALNEMFFLAEVTDKTEFVKEDVKYDGNTLSSLAIKSLKQTAETGGEGEREEALLAIKYLTCLIEGREVPQI